MKQAHIHKDTYYISFIYDGLCCFAMPHNDEIDCAGSEEKESVVVNSYGIPTALSRRELLNILKEDATTIVKQYTYEQWLNNEMDQFEAEHDASWLY